MRGWKVYAELLNGNRATNILIWAAPCTGPLKIVVAASASRANEMRASGCINQVTDSQEVKRSRNSPSRVQQRPDHRMRYFIHIRLGQKLYKDRDGCEFCSLEDARDEAVQAVRVLLDDEELADLPTEQSFDIQDEGGNTVMLMPFSDAFSLR